MKLKSKKSNKLKKKKLLIKEIGKQELTPEEREAKLRKDRIKIAKRYEEMRLYDEAINYYKKLDLPSDVERVTQIKNEIYRSKAQEFESKGKLEDAARLYENLKMMRDLNRVKKLMGEEDYIYEEEADSGQEPTTVSTLENRDIDLNQDSSITTSVDDAIDDALEDEGGETIDLETVVEQDVIQPDETVINKGEKKIFKICPYCGQELNLPKKPNFCPYCKEAFV